MLLRSVRVLVGIIGACLAASAAEKPAVAVNDFDPQGIERPSVIIITERLRNELFKSGIVSVVERGQMEAILKEQGFQQSGCTSDACAVEMGQMLGVQYIIAGTVGKIGRTHTITARLIDVKTGKIMQMSTIDCRCSIDDLLSQKTAKIADELVTGLKQRAEAPVIKKGTVKVVTDPPGAVLNVNGTQWGLTP